MWSGKKHLGAGDRFTQSCIRALRPLEKKKNTPPKKNVQSKASNTSTGTLCVVTSPAAFLLLTTPHPVGVTLFAHNLSLNIRCVRAKLGVISTSFEACVPPLLLYCLFLTQVRFVRTKPVHGKRHTTIHSNENKLFFLRSTQAILTRRALSASRRTYVRITRRTNNGQVMCTGSLVKIGVAGKKSFLTFEACDDSEAAAVCDALVDRAKGEKQQQKQQGDQEKAAQANPDHKEGNRDAEKEAGGGPEKG